MKNIYKLLEVNNVRKNCKMTNASCEFLCLDKEFGAKQILDVIALHAMVDDNSLLCDVHHTSQPGDADETKVFVMEKSRFPYWLEELQKA